VFCCHRQFALSFTMLFSLKYVGHDEQAVTYGHG
jgi:hypothetical protein